MAIKISGVNIVDNSQNLRITGLSTFTNGPVLIGTATSTGTASQRLQVTGGGYVSGSVGIGLTAPNELLEVAGNIRVSGADRSIFNRSNNALTFGTNNAERARISSAGLFGIGESAPNYRLDVFRNASNDIARLRVGTNTVLAGLLRLEKTRDNTTANTEIAVQNGDNIFRIVSSGSDGTAQVTSALISFNVDGAVSSGIVPGNIRLFTTNTAGVNDERARINSAGNFGIATVDPYQTLTIRGQNQQLLLDINSETNGTYASIAWNGSSTNLLSNNYSAEIRGYRTAAGAHGALAFHTRDNSNTSLERMRIDRDGRVLIGTSVNLSGTAGTGSLQIATSGSTQAWIARYSNAIAGPAFVFHKSRNNNVGSHTAAIANDTLGNLLWRGSDGTGFVDGASIRGVVDGNVAADSVPGRIVFNITPVGGTTLTEAFRITSDNVIAYNQSNPISKSAAATLTIAELKSGIIQYTGAAATLTLPTGTLTQAGFGESYVNLAFDWSVINTGSGTCTIGGATGHTIIGSNTVTAGSSARFASRRTGTNIIVSYRLS
jgi:hypothetical protein